MGICTKLLKTVALATVIFFIPGLPPFVDFDVITVAPTRPFQDGLDPKSYALDKMERIFEGRIIGPESIEQSPTDPGTFYTALQDGDIVKISNNGTQLTSLGVRLSKNCPSRFDPNKCGRPLGLRFDRNKRNLIVSDAYLGIFKIDIETGKSVNLVSNEEEVDGRINRIFNGIAPSKQSDKIYYTVSGTNYYFHQGVGEMFGSPSGRLMVYDRQTKKSSVLKEKLHFPNGMLLSPDEDSIVFAETMQFRLLKYWLKGPKSGSLEVLLEGLPGNPDNVNLSPDGNILVSLVTVHKPEDFNPAVFMYGHPCLRKFILRLIHLIRLPLDLAVSILDLSLAKFLNYYIMNFEGLKALLLPYGMIVEVDWNGRIINSWHTQAAPGTMPFFSDAKILSGYLYVGSPFNDYLGRLPLDS